jgi:hypothetical protein
VPPRTGAPRLTGGFIQYQPWMMSLAASDWRRELAAMRRAGMTLVIVQWLASGGNRYMPDGPGHVDPTEVILEEADRTGMEVFVGLTTDEDWWDHATEAAYLKGAAAASTAVAEEGWIRYGSHPAFAGWYMPQETWDGDFDVAQVGRLRTFFRTVTDRCHALSGGKPVGTSPFFAAKVTPAVVERTYTDMLRGSGLDILIPQDGVGAQGCETDVEGHVVPYFRAYESACRATGVRLWSDVESFRIVNGPPLNDKPTEFVPADVRRLARQMTAEAPLASRLVTFDFFHYMSPYRGTTQKALYDAYLKWLAAHPASAAPASAGRLP